MKAFGVGLVALATALATGLGALPFLAVKKMSPAWIGISNALAGGAMLGASARLYYEGGSLSVGRTAVGAVLGALFVWVSHKVLAHPEEFRLGELRGVDARRALLLLGVMTVHSFTEGVGVGVSFAGGRELGILISIAIAIHNIPEGLAISLTLVPAGTSVRNAAAWSIFSSLPQPLMAVPAFLGVRVFEPLLPAGLGFAAGAMVWLVVASLIPAALATIPRSTFAYSLGAGAAVMLLLGAALG